MNKQLLDIQTEEAHTPNTGLTKVAVQCSADTFVVKIATFAKPENVSDKCNKRYHDNEENSINILCCFKR